MAGKSQGKKDGAKRKVDSDENSGSPKKASIGGGGRPDGKVYGVYFGDTKVFQMHDCMTEAECALANLSPAELQSMEIKPIVKIFEGQEMCDEFLKEARNPSGGQPEDEEDIVLPVAAKASMNVEESTETADMPSLEILSKNVAAARNLSNREEEAAIAPAGDVGTSPRLKGFQANLQRMNMAIVVHHWPDAPEPALYKVMPVVVEVLETKLGFTYWLHRTRCWSDLIKYFSELEGAPKTSNILLSIKTMSMSDGRGNLSVKAPGSSLKRDGMFMLLPRAANPLPKVKNVFKQLIGSKEHREAYKMSYTNTCSNSDAMNMLSEENPRFAKMGQFWSMLRSNIDALEIKEHSSLSEVLMPDEVADIMSMIYGVPKMNVIEKRNIPVNLIELAYGEHSYGG